MKVSVAMITYNHERFIAKALDSVLMQKTNFGFEIVVGEDCSSDATRDILIDYRERYPQRFRLFLNEQNLGMYRNGKQTLEACQGEYIAFLEGDDYWTSADKLQKQVNFLDRHPECSLCFHDALITYADGSRQPQRYCGDRQKAFSTIEDILQKNFAPTCSLMVRRGLFDIPDRFKFLPMGDWPALVLTAMHGKLGYINEVMACYVIHPGGAWFSIRENWEDQTKTHVAFYNGVYPLLDRKCRRIVENILRDLYLRTSERYATLGNLAEARSYAIRCLTKYPFLTKRHLKVFLRLYLPRMYTLLLSAQRSLRS